MENGTTSIHIDGKLIELYISEPAVELFAQHAEDFKPQVGFSAYEFAYLVYLCAVNAAHKNDKKTEVDFIKVFDEVKSLIKSTDGQAEIERIAKSFMQCEAYKKVATNYQKM